MIESIITHYGGRGGCKEEKPSTFIVQVYQGWQKTRVLPYCPAQQVILGKPGFYRVLLGNTGHYLAI